MKTLHKVEATHKKQDMKEKLGEFWMRYSPLLSIIFILIIGIILLYEMAWAAAIKGVYIGTITGSEANHYEHLGQIVCYIGGI